MTEPMCRIVHDLWDRLRDGALTPTERERVERHLAACEPCRRTAQLRGLIAPLAAESELDPIARRRLEVAIRTRRAPSLRRGRALEPLLAIGFALGAATVLALVLPGGQSGGGSREREPLELPKAAAKEEVARSAHAAPSVAPETVEVAPGTRLWMDRSARLEALRICEKEVRYALGAGRIVVSIGPHAPGFRFAVKTPRAQIEARGTVFSIDVAANGTETIRVAESAVEVQTEIDGLRHIVREGEQLTIGRLQPEEADEASLAADLCAVRASACPREAPIAEGEHRAAPPSAQKDAVGAYKTRALAAIDGGRYGEAESLLTTMSGVAPAEDRLDVLTRIARAYRQSGMYDLAAATYARLGREFPNSDAAVGGLVALAQLEQGPLGDPAVALGHFEAYLSVRPDGVLAETARAGEVRALVQLGRSAEVVRAADAYLAAHPDGLAADEIRRRRAEAVSRERLEATRDR